MASAEKPRVGARFAPRAARAWTPRGRVGAMFRAIDAAALSRAEATRGVVARAIRASDRLRRLARGGAPLIPLGAGV